MISPRTPRKGLRKAALKRSRMKRRPKSKALMLRTHGTPEHRAWMKAQPCIVCGRTPSDAAHLKSGGTGRKDDWQNCVPLCSDFPDQGCIARGCHSRYDDGKYSFRRRYEHLDFEVEAAKCAGAWLAHLDGAA